MQKYDPHNPMTWEWRAEYRDGSTEHGYGGEWQINAYPEGGNSPLWLASLGPGQVAEDAEAARLMAAAPDLLDALKYALSVILVYSGTAWAGECEERIGGALRKALPPPERHER